MQGGYSRIVTSLFTSVEDPMATYQKLRGALTMGGRASASSHGQIIDALDAAEDNAATAMELLVNAKVTHDSFEIDAKILLAALRDRATSVLEDEKAKGERKKAITEADVESTMGAMFPDEWRALEDRRGKAKRMVAMIEDLAERCRQRAGHLRVMARSARE